MEPQAEKLWKSIESFPIDDAGAQLTYTKRLARENEWSLAYARRVVAEYRRFVFLAMVADHEATPSQTIDEAWHLHLTYTKNYWDGLCRTVLGRPLHHVPTLGGVSERSRHDEQYRQTIDSYKKWFGEVPPADIWPTMGEHIQSAKLVYVDRQRAWVIPKPNLPKEWFKRTPMYASALAAPLMLGLANPLEMSGADFLLFFATVSAIAIAIAFLLRMILRSNAAPMAATELTPYEIACLSGGTPAILRAGLAKMVAESRLVLKTNLLVPNNAVVAAAYASSSNESRRQLKESERDLEKEMYAAADDFGVEPKKLFEAGLPAAEEIQSDLQARGLLENSSSFAAARFAPIILLSLVWLLGAAKVLIGLQRQRPVSILVLACILLGYVIFRFWRSPYRTRAGNQLLRELKSNHASLKKLGSSHSDAVSSPDYLNNLLLAAGLFGLASITYPSIQSLNSTLKPQDASGFWGTGTGTGYGCSGSSCSSGDGGGGGGCGSGCGGCGGGGD